MNIVVDIGHPAHVHYFKNIIKLLSSNGHKFLVFARNREDIHTLLKKNRITYINRGQGASGKVSRFLYLIKTNILIYKYSKLFKANMFLSVASPYASQVSFLLRKPSIAITDTEHAKLGIWAFAAFSRYILTPYCFKGNFGKKHVRMNGLLEMLYLHPNYFVPKEHVLDQLGVQKGDVFTILRFISWGAEHDKGYKGLSDEDKRKTVDKISKYSRVFISSESPLPPDLENFKMNIEPDMMHDAISYSSLFFGESGTMAVEAALLGVPSVRVSPLAKYLGNFIELRNNYSLVYFYDEFNEGLEKCIKILENRPNRSWQVNSDRFIKEHNDINEIIIGYIEGNR